ncbi:MAG: GntR family transcriptional regulator [Alphaproteobacteria bacterium]|nr:MAG: GntR family transcriptional regulator [Alphaproteobacteria bacterium]
MTNGEIAHLPEHPAQRSIYQVIRERLATGELVAGQKLKPDALRRDFGCSASTLREVLFRLACGGYVDFEEQRGFRVPSTSLARLVEIRHLRILVESEAAALSIANGDMEWEARLNAAHHKLAHLEFRMQTSARLRQNIPIWTRFDWEFHETLVSACGSQLLMETLHTLFYRYRQQLVGIVQDYGFRPGTIDEHRQILEAALARDPDACAAGIRRHFAFIDALQPSATDA